MFAVARNNIAARYPPQPQQQRVGHLRGDGHSYCDSAALVPGWLSSFATDSGPRPLVFFPGDEVLLVCTDDPEVAPEFFAAAERLYRQAVVPVSPQGYTIAGDTIVPLDRAGPTPVRSLAVRARSVLADGEYLAQTERLQRYFAEQVLDAQAGSVQLIETPRGSCTMTVWGEGASWLLPEADYVTFLSGDQSDYFTVPFPVVADVVGLVADPELGAGAVRGGGVARRRRDGRSARAFRAPCPGSDGPKLRRQDSNLNCLNQNQRCCRLHHDGSLRPAVKTASTLDDRVGRSRSAAAG